MLAATAAEAARRFGASPAFVSDEGLTLSYQQFDTLADEAAAGLAALGVGEGDVGVAVVVPHADGATPDLAWLRAHAGERLVRDKLLDDMVVLSALPLTAGEKVDRRALKRLIAPG